MIGAASARLDDNATARDLSVQLPLMLTFRDHNNVERTAPLPRELLLDGAPEGHDPVAGDIGYWAPGGDVVSYLRQRGAVFNGIVRIGEFDGNMDAIERQSEGFSVTIERAGPSAISGANAALALSAASRAPWWLAWRHARVPCDHCGQRVALAVWTRPRFNSYSHNLL